MLINCQECAGKVSSEAAACPHCGTPDFLTETKDQAWQRTLKQVGESALKGNCPVCHVGNLAKMDAGSRGSAFGQGNLIGAFSKSHRCSNCGYLA